MYIEKKTISKEEAKKAKILIFRDLSMKEQDLYTELKSKWTHFKLSFFSYVNHNYHVFDYVNDILIIAKPGSGGALELILIRETHEEGSGENQYSQSIWPATAI